MEFIRISGISLNTRVDRVHRFGIYQSPLSRRDGAIMLTLGYFAESSTENKLLVSSVTVANVKGVLEHVAPRGLGTEQPLTERVWVMNGAGRGMPRTH